MNLPPKRVGETQAPGPLAGSGAGRGRCPCGGGSGTGLGGELTSSTGGQLGAGVRAGDRPRRSCREEQGAFAWGQSRNWDNSKLVCTSTKERREGLCGDSSVTLAGMAWKTWRRLRCRGHAPPAARAGRGQALPGASGRDSPARTLAAAQGNQLQTPSSRTVREQTCCFRH